MMRVGSLFAGIGGFDLGFERAGFPIVWQCEIDAHCRRVLARHWPDVQRYEDVRDLRGDDLADVDVLAGGFPCQDLSVAGRRAGLDGTRSGLWWEFARLVDECRPAWVVLENVTGLLSSRGGRDMGTVLATLGDMGYGWAYRVLDAQWFGLAQRRARVFVVGCARERTGAAQVLLEPESRAWSPRPGRPSRTLPARDAPTCADGHSRPDAPHTGPLIPTTAYALRACGGQVNDADRITLLPLTFAHQAVEADTTIEVDWTPPLTASQTIAVHPAASGPVRRLTPVECERLQGFPDDWTARTRDTHRYRMLGNAVPVPIAEWIARRIMQYTAGELRCG